LRDSLFLVIVVFVTFVNHLNEELGFAVFANKLFIVARVKLACAERTKRDFGAHAS